MICYTETALLTFYTKVYPLMIFLYARIIADDFYVRRYDHCRIFHRKKIIHNLLSTREVLMNCLLEEFMVNVFLFGKLFRSCHFIIIIINDFSFRKDHPVLVPTKTVCSLFKLCFSLRQ